MIYRTDLAVIPRINRLGCKLGEFFLVVLQSCRIRDGNACRIVLYMISERPVGKDIERHIIAPASDADYTARSERMAHAELVPDVWVIDGQIRDDQIGHKQLLEHVRANIPG